MYGDFEFTSTASISEDMFNRTVTINGLSKSVAMTGWSLDIELHQIVELVKAMNRFQSQSTSNVNSITQSAAIKGLDGTVDGEIEDMRRLFERRRDRAVELINSIDGLSVVKPRWCILSIYKYQGCI